MIRGLLILAIALTLAACASRPIDEEGPDTRRTIDADGMPNFGPK